MFNWKTVYEIYRNSLATGVSYSRFTRFRKLNFPKLKISKYTPLTKCNFCIDSKFQKVNNNDLRSDLSRKISQHYDLIRSERNNYHNRIVDSTFFADKMSLIIDGMTSIIVPHRYPFPKSHSNTNPVKFVPYGLICHSLKKRMIYILPPNQHSDSNYVISIIWLFLLEYYEEKGSFPKVLYIQSDNASKEVRNKFALSFFSILVNRGYIEQIHISMLPVGHTHADIDQMFSTISKKIKRSNIESLYELIEIIKKSFINEEIRPDVRLIHQLWDFKNWLSDRIQPFKGISNYHSFLILKSIGSQYSIIKYKEYTRDEHWVGEFEAIRWRPIYAPNQIKLSIKIDNICAFKSLPFLSEFHKTIFINMVKYPSSYGNILNLESHSYSKPFHDLLSPLTVINHFLPVLQNQNHDSDDESQEENIMDIITVPNIPQKIQRLEVAKNGFFVISPISRCEDHYQLVKVKNIPAQFSTSSWIDVDVYSRNDRYYKKCGSHQIQVADIACKVINLQKISEGEVFLSLRAHQKLQANILSKKIF